MWKRRKPCFHISGEPGSEKTGIGRNEQMSINDRGPTTEGAEGPIVGRRLKGIWRRFE
jgi:hypothetical protein